MFQICVDRAVLKYRVRDRTWTARVHERGGWKNCVEVEAEAAILGHSLNAWWAARASIHVNGRRWVQRWHVLFQNADYIPYLLSLGSTGAGLQAFSLC